MRSIQSILVAGIFLILFIKYERVSGLSCFCGAAPCETPKCCDSGSYTTDACGCCPICAKGVDDTCGGPFRTAGNCDVGLSCVKKCSCKTEDGDECIFPFTFNETTYNRCTAVESVNNKTWCALEVDGNGVVIDGKWGDCDFSCPQEDYECDSTYFFNSLGRCLNKTEADSLMGRSSAGVQVEDGISDSDTAPSCKEISNVNQCRCSEDPLSPLTGSKTGKPCEPLSSNFGSEANGWCFLTNIQDPANPSKDCYEDVEWSETHGKFWSNMACESQTIQGRAGLNPEEGDDDYDQPTFEDGFIDSSEVIYDA
nr:Cysteine-rich motor neuron 1 protein [Lepeophtheirus salmonis]